jgi:hypothetical protein
MERAKSAVPGMRFNVSTLPRRNIICHCFWIYAILSLSLCLSFKAVVAHENPSRLLLQRLLVAAAMTPAEWKQCYPGRTLTAP